MKWREVPPIISPEKQGLRYEGLTELTHNGRTWSCVGVGERVRAALAERAK